MKNARRIPAARVLVGAVFAVCALAWAPAAIAAPSVPIVTGTVVNGTTGKPVPDLATTLHLFSDTAELGSMKATTDAKGAFSFADLATDAKGYQVTAVYKDVLYRTQMAALTPGTPIDVSLKVYETTTDPANIVQGSWIVWIDREGSGFAVQHTIQWNNSGDMAYTGSPSPSGGAPIATQVPLAVGATNFQFLGTYIDTPGQVQGSMYVNPQPILPGTTEGTVRYTVGELTHITLPIDLPTASLELYVQTGVDAKANGLTPSGQLTESGKTYERYSASNLQAGDKIEVSISGDVGGKGSSKILIGVLGGLIVILAGGLALWFFAGRSRRPRAATGRNAAGRRPAQGKRRQVPARSSGRRDRTPARPPAHHPSAPEDVDEVETSEDRFDLLIDEIAALDLAHEKGLLQDRTYEAIRADAKERLLRLRTKTGEGSSR